ncbi:MAG TPA: biopolymer transporter ExbD [Thermoguttaceae bacterium]|nr:biopolymer transporter ExbD [Thermoguttaceae bacterium]
MKKYESKRGAPFAKGDMTPMIDMTFQLIAFFMVLINFAAEDQNVRINLPASELAKPPDKPLESAITVQVTKKAEGGTVIVGPEETKVEGLLTLMHREAESIRKEDRVVGKATIIIRADRNAETGLVQDVITICQKAGFKLFRLRAEQKEART